VNTKSVIRAALYACLEVALVSAWTCQASPATVDVTKPTVDMSIYGHVVKVGWVVKNLDGVVNKWERLGLRNIQRSGVKTFSDVTYRGKKMPLSVKMAFGDIGGVRVEWIQPVAGFSVYDEFLREHTDGVHHLAYAVKNPEQFAEQLKYFDSKGVGVVQRGSWTGIMGKGLFAYLDTAPGGGGLTIELIYDPDRPPTTAAGSSSNEYPFDKIVHYAFVVHDVRKVGEFYESLGFGGMPVKDNISGDRILNTKPAKFEERLGFWQHGEVPFEWIQPLVGPSVEDKYFKSHGEGFHHLAFNVTDMDAAVKLFQGKGISVSQSGSWDDPGSRGRWAYFDTEPHGGVTIELIWRAP
jgi:catechol 2,3-dioxygenase-like lactoylglutathione lyase family enzyme